MDLEYYAGEPCAPVDVQDLVLARSALGHGAEALGAMLREWMTEELNDRTFQIGPHDENLEGLFHALRAFEPFDGLETVYAAAAVYRAAVVWPTVLDQVESMFFMRTEGQISEALLAAIATTPIRYFRPIASQSVLLDAMFRWSDTRKGKLKTKG